MAEGYIMLDFIKLKQPVGEFYIAKISHGDLIDICYSDIRDIEHDGDFEKYLGIQRELDPKRVKDLRQYVTLSDSSFPTSIILSISNKRYHSEYSAFNVPVDEIFENLKLLDDKFMEERNIYIANHEGKEKLFIKRDDRIAKIIDGQHRIEGLKHYAGENGIYELNVTIFQDLDIEEQAILFATINKTQTKVNKSRVYDLYDLAKSRSPFKTCHNVAKFLNQKEGSPFQDLIKILGTADDKRETITQSTFVECLVPYISNNPVIDRDIIKKGGSLKLVAGKELIRHFFRNLFVEQKDAYIAKNISNYFNAIKNTWLVAWENQNLGQLLSKSTGFVSFCRFYRDVYLFLSRKEGLTEIDENKLGEVYTYEQYLKVIEPMRERITDAEFVTDNFDPGGSGRSQLYKRLKEASGI